MMQSHSSRSITICAMLTATGLILGYLENFIVLPVHIPGVRIGLANIVSLMAFYLLGPVYAVTVTGLRIILSAVLFGSPVSFIYSASGAAVSLLGMYVFSGMGFSVYGVSVACAVLHNTAQITVAYFLIGSGYVFYYLGPLWAVAAVSGLIVGFLADILISRLVKVIGKGEAK